MNMCDMHISTAECERLMSIESSDRSCEYQSGITQLATSNSNRQKHQAYTTKYKQQSASSFVSITQQDANKLTK